MGEGGAQGSNTLMVLSVDEVKIAPSDLTTPVTLQSWPMSNVCGVTKAEKFTRLLLSTLKDDS